MQTSTMLAIFGTGMPGWGEIVILLGIGVLIFGKRLPEVGRNIGRGIVEFKKGLRGIEDDVADGVDDGTPKRIEPGATAGPSVAVDTERHTDEANVLHTDHESVIDSPASTPTSPRTPRTPS